MGCRIEVDLDLCQEDTLREFEGPIFFTVPNGGNVEILDSESAVDAGDEIQQVIDMWPVRTFAVALLRTIER